MRGKHRVSHWPLTILGSASSLFNLFLPIVMSRRLSQAEVGEYKIFFLYLAAIPALSLGVGFTNGAYLWGADPLEGENKIKTAFLIALLSGFTASAVAFFSGFYLGWSYSLIFFAAACPPAVASTIFEARLVAAGQVKKAAVFSAGFEFLRLASLLGAMLAGFGITAIFALHALGSWAKLLAGGAAIGILSPRNPFFKKEYPALLKYAVPVSIAAVFDLLILNADRYTLSALLYANDFAIYAFGCLLVPPLIVFEQSMNQVLIPKLAGSVPRTRAAPAMFRSAVEDLLLIMIPAAAGLMAISEPLVRLLFTDLYRGAAIYLSWFALFYALLAVPQDVLARARGDSKWILRTSVVFGLAALVASMVAAHFFGALCALQAFLLMQASRRGYGLAYFMDMENCRFGSMFPIKGLLIFGVAAAIAGFFSRYASLQANRPGFAVLLGCAAFIPVYFGIVFSFRRQALLRLVRSRRKR